MCEVMTRYGLVNINNPTYPVTMTIDYECSGIIETTAYIGMVAFFPMYNSVERVFFGVVGTLWIDHHGHLFPGNKNQGAGSIKSLTGWRMRQWL